jgi:multisubunit Na+/H+ antiporter MnhF subunit
MIKFTIFFTIMAMVVIMVAFLQDNKDLATKVIFVNITTSLTILFIVLLGFFQKDESLIDIAIIYAILSFAVSATLLFYVKSKLKL